MIGSTLSHYRVLEVLGQGGMGIVYRARDERLERDVAIKVLPPSALLDEAARKRFRKEAMALSRLDHPAICAIYDFDTQDGVDFIVMQYVAGETLAQRIASGSLSELQAASLAAQISAGLDAAHERGIVHRDLKPANIKVTPAGQLKILDFGLAKLLEAEQGRSAIESLTGPDLIVGTLPYMAPEQLRGEPIDARVDLYALGATMFELLTGKPPYHGGPATALVERILLRPPPLPSALRPELSPRMDEIILKALEKDPDYRYQHARDLAADLRRVERDLKGGTMPMTSAAIPTGGVAAPTPVGSRAAAARSSSFARRALAWSVAGLIGAAVTFAALRVLVPRLGLGVGATDASTLLILPLEVRGQAEGGPYVGEAFAEALAIELAGAKNLKVLEIPTREGDLDPVKRGRAAGAGRVLTGTLIRTGGALQANLKLLDTKDRRILWGAVRDASRTDLPGLASDLAREAASQLGGEMRHAYDYPLYLSGDPRMVGSPEASRVLESWRRGESMATVARWSEQLVKTYPKELGALALHAFMLTQVLDDEGSAAARMALEKTIAKMKQIDPRNPYGDYFRARILFEGEKVDRSRLDAVFARLLVRDDLHPGCRAWFLRNHATWSLGGSKFWQYVLDLPVHEQRRYIGRDISLPLKELEEAVRLDPANPWSHLYYGRALQAAGRPEDALGHARRAMALEPRFFVTQMTVAMLLASQSRWQEAFPYFQTSVRLDDAVGFAHALLALALAKVGRTAEARTEALKAERQEMSDLAAYHLARYWAFAGDPRRALEHLHNAVRLGFRYDRVAGEPEFSDLQGDPEFMRLVGEVRRRTVRPSRP